MRQESQATETLKAARPHPQTSLSTPEMVPKAQGQAAHTGACRWHVRFKLYQQGLVPFAQSEALGQSIRVVGACTAKLLYSKGTVWEPLTAFKGLSETLAPVGPVSSKSPQHPHMASATVRDHEL